MGMQAGKFASGFWWALARGMFLHQCLELRISRSCRLSAALCTILVFPGSKSALTQSSCLMYVPKTASRLLNMSPPQDGSLGSTPLASSYYMFSRSKGPDDISWLPLRCYLWQVIWVTTHKHTEEHWPIWVYNKVRSLYAVAILWLRSGSDANTSLLVVPQSMGP